MNDVLSGHHKSHRGDSEEHWALEGAGRKQIAQSITFNLLAFDWPPPLQSNNGVAD